MRHERLAGDRMELALQGGITERSRFHKVFITEGQRQTQARWAFSIVRDGSACRSDAGVETIVEADLHGNHAYRAGATPRRPPSRS